MLGLPPDASIVDVVLAISDERDQQLHLRLAAWRAGWDACLDHFADLLGGRIYPAHPTELEILRWGPGGREHFGDPRPGDYTPREVA